VKDAFHRYVVCGQNDAVNPRQVGTKAAAHLKFTLQSGESRTIHLRLSAEGQAPKQPFGRRFTEIFEQRIAEADAFYEQIIEKNLDAPRRQVTRQAYAGLLFTKQFYHYSVQDWLDGDPHMPPPPAERKQGRNADWRHLFNRDVISMPDKWEYPWYAAWD